MTSSYYRGAQGVILVYDVSSRESFEALDTWWNEVNTYCSSPDVVKMIVGNKVDKVRKLYTQKEKRLGGGRRVVSIYLFIYMSLDLTHIHMTMVIIIIIIGIFTRCNIQRRCYYGS